MIKRVVVLLLTLLPMTTWASVQLGLFDVKDTDRSLYYLKNIFGNFGYIIDAGAYHNPIMGQMYMVLNSVVFTIGVVFLLYSAVMALINTASEGTFMGKKSSPFWTPVKAALGLLLLLPTSSGYSNVQIGAMWFILNGIGAGNAVWTAMLNENFFQPPLATFEAQVSANFMKNLFRVAACVEFMNSRVHSDAFVTVHTGRPATRATAFATGGYGDTRMPFGSTTPDNILFAQLELGSPSSAAITAACGRVNMPDYRALLDSNSLSSATFTRDVVAQTMKQEMAGIVTDVIQSLQVAGFDFTSDLGSGATWSNFASIRNAEALFVEGAAGLSQDTADIFGVDASDWITPPMPSVPTYLADASNDGDAATEAPSVQPTSPVPSPLNGAHMMARYLDGHQQLTHELYVQDTNQPILAENAFSAAANEAPVTRFDQPLALSLAPRASATTTTANPHQAIYDNGWIHAGSYYFELMRNAAQSSSQVLYSEPSVSVPTAATFQNVWGLTTAEANTVFSQFNAKIDAYWTKYEAFVTSLSAGSTKSATKLSMAPTNPGTVAGWAPLPDMSGVLSKFGDHLFQRHTDPLYSMSKFGMEVVDTIETVFFSSVLTLIAILAISATASCTQPFVWAVAIAIQLAAPIMGVVIAILWVPCITLGMYIPMIPYFVYLAAALGWLILVIEAVTAAPLVAIGFLMPSQDEFGKAAQAGLLISGLFLRPMLMVIGFAAGTAIVRLFIEVISQGFMSTVSTMIGKITLFGFIPMLGVYTGIAMSTVNESFSLIYNLPDKILRWIGMSPESSSSKMVKAFEQANKQAAEKSGAAAQAGFKAVEASAGTIAGATGGGGGEAGGGGGGGPPAGGTPAG